MHGTTSKQRAWRAAAAIASGGLYWAAFPPLDRGWLGWVALVPLLVALRGTSVRAGFALGSTTGAVAATLLVTPSLYAGMAPFLGGLPWAAPLLAVLVPVAYGGAYVGLFGACVARLAPRVRSPFWRPLAIAAAWSACELLRARLFYGNPWAQLGQTLVSTPVWVQVADLGGVAAVSFVPAAVNVALASRCWRGALTAAAVALAAWAYGVVRLDDAVAGDATPVRIVAVQPAVPEDWRYALTHTGDVVRRLIATGGDLAGAAPDLVIWPENAISVDVDANTGVLAQIAASVPAPARLLLGAPRVVASDGRARLRNAAVLLDPDGGVTAAYDKRRLTPFGEYYPLGLERFLGAAARPSTQYDAGTSPAPLSLGAHRIGVLICLEATFADAARDAVRAGADVLVNLANDGWFGTGPLAEQHLRAAMLRAVETRRPFVRVDNAGVTAVVDARGVVIGRLPRDVPGRLALSIVPGRGSPWYVALGDAFGIACGAAAALLWRRRRAERTVP